MKITFEDLLISSQFYRISDFKDLKPYRKFSKIIALNDKGNKIKIDKSEIVYTDKGEINRIIAGLHWKKSEIKPLSFFYIINPFKIKDSFWNNKGFLHRLPSKRELNRIYV